MLIKFVVAIVFFYYERGKVDIHDVEGRTSPMMGTPHLWAHAYKLWVGGVSPRCGIEWINAGGIGLLGLFPKRTIPFKGDVRPSTNYLMGTPHLWAHAYKLRVGGVSPNVGLSKSVWVASASSAHSQSGQYLLRERFVPPHTATHHIYMISVDALYRFQGLNTNYNHKTS